MVLSDTTVEDPLHFTKEWRKPSINGSIINESIHNYFFITLAYLLNIKDIKCSWCTAGI